MNQSHFRPCLAALSAVFFLAISTAITSAVVPTTENTPDSFGYKYSVSSDSSQYNFIDLTNLSGTSVHTLTPLPNRDDGAQNIDIGFGFAYYANTYTSCFPSTNGEVVFGASSVDYSPEAIFGPEMPHNFIAPFFTDMTAFTAADGSANTGVDPHILYATLGAAPNRICVIQWQDMRQYLAPSVRVTFQVQLFEGSNQIKFVYKSIPTLTAIGNELSIGIEGPLGAAWGNTGLQYYFGLQESVGSLAGKAITITRPVKVTVESQYRNPDGALVDAGKSNPLLTPSIGTTNAIFQSVQRFEAPEFIYLNQAFAELADMGDPNDPTAANIARYRLRNLGYAIDGETVTGAERFFERTVTGDLKVIWRWDLEFAVFVEFKNPAGGTVDAGNGIGNPDPVVGRSWVTKNTQFSASVDRVAGLDPLGLDLSGLRYTAQSYQLNIVGTDGVRRDKPAVAVGSAGNRAVTENVTISDWLRVRWTWTGQVRYRFDATSLDATQGNPPLFESFVILYNNDTPATVKSIAYGSAAANQVWLDLGAPVRVGSYYRTFDRRSTMHNFVSAPTGDLGGLGSDISVLTDLAVNDAQSRLRIARVSPMLSAGSPSEAHFVLQPTVFRAEIPLGQSLDANNPNVQTNPALPDGAVLRTADRGPNGTFTRVGPYVPDGTPNGASERWDQLGACLLPVHPGSYQFDWPDANDPTTTYRIEIVSGYPNDTVALASEREMKAPDASPSLSPGGKRYGAAPAYVTTTQLAAADAAFPAAPGAHYRHRHAATPDRNPPTKLDLSTTDAWKFQQLTFADRATKATVDDATPGVPFATQGNGRCVLLYSYRPNPDEIADGTPADEQLAVRVVQSDLINPILPDDPKLVLGRRGLKLGGSSATDGSFGIIQRGSPPPASVTPGNNFVIDFWLNAKGLAADAGALTVLSTKTDALKVTLDPATSTLTTIYRGMPLSQPLPRTGASWHHCVVHVFGDTFFGYAVTILDAYVDGVRQEQGYLTAMLGGASAMSDVAATVTANSLRIGVGAGPDSQVQLDQFRLFTLASGNARWLSSAEVLKLRTQRDLKTNPQLRSIAPQLWFSFAGAPAAGSFANDGTLANVGLGPVAADTTGVYASSWAHLDIQEVATRLESTLDNANFGGSGYILNAVSNYNAGIYNRAAEIGTWGAIFPVNHGKLYTDPNRRLEVAYYENPFLGDPLLHVNVAWPYEAAGYDEVIYPKYGPHADKAIYVASRIGSEGVDQKGRPQAIFDLARFTDLTIYNQPDNTHPGYNPNEEHALAAPSGRAALKVKNLGDDVPNNPPLAAFALQNDINATSTSYTSDPWVLVRVTNLVTGEPDMAAYQVFKTRPGAVAFPRPTNAVVTATPGLAYESAANPDDAFLTLDAGKSFNFSYQFDYPVYAGDLLIPPYPLNLVIGNVAMLDARGNSLQVNGVNQRSLWRDVNSNAWVVSGNGRFFHQFFYPFRGDFFLPGTAAGTPVAWLPDNGVSFTGAGTSLNPVKVVYETFWRSDYPKLKRGETLTYQGGEYFSENPGSNGLPALVAMASAEVIYDSATPSMILGGATTNRYDVSTTSARIIRPLDRRENLFTTAQMGSAGFTPASSSKLFIVAERWYFKDLPGSLQKRFYFDSLAGKLVFRGRLNDKESGDPKLTVGPDPLNILEPNVMTADDHTRIRALATDSAWTAAIDKIYLTAQNPHAVPSGNTDASLPIYNLQGIKPVPNAYPLDLTAFWSISGGSYGLATSPAPAFVHLDSFGVGSALVPSPGLLTQAPNGSLYITIAENNRSELSGAPVSLHIIEIIPDRYRGAIKVIEAADAFSEKISLQHNGEFGANTGDLYYEWWIRDAGPLDVVAAEVHADGTLAQTDASGHSLWQEYLPKDRALLSDPTAQHVGLHSIVFEGRPDVVLADKLILMRYRHKTEANWTLVPFEITNPSASWKPGTVAPVSKAPFQWAGAANSPQLQADGSKRYIPQLVMGWVKRVLDRINPYEARYTDFFSNETPATYSSQIQIAGGPFAGKVALNPDKNVIENTGLIELYETVLARARELSIDNSSNGNATDGINQALLLAATRLSVLYELLASEAYSDAQDSTIAANGDDGMAGVASYTFAFQNMEPDLMHEELALLRGTDFLKSYPVYNRLFWNYAKGLGEAAYNVNYNIHDANKDGFINEDDARILYPQGHGDAWGHYLSALGMHYALLQAPGFTWEARSELYSLMQNVLQVDFLDEKTFARLAAGKARAGRDIVRGTYRMNYTQDPDGQWQGYTDGADPARAWGVSEWAHRAAQGAYFDWAVANALLPAAAAGTNPENLDLIERSAAEDEIGEVAGGLYEIQVAMDEANGGVNPLGFDSDAIAFDIDLEFYTNASGGDRRSQFEQVYTRAVTAGVNALTTLDFATQSGNKLRALADDTDGLLHEAMSQDLDYRNRLIDIFGRPYDGTIGFGKAYPEGYLGPDTLLFAYLDKTKIDQFVPQLKPSTDASTVHFNALYKKAQGYMDDPRMVALYSSAGVSSLKSAFTDLLGSSTYEMQTQLDNLSLSYNTASKYAFQVNPADGWGQRTSYGKVQGSLQDMLADEFALDSAISEYVGFLKDFENKIKRLDSQLALFDLKNQNHEKIRAARVDLNAELITLNTVFAILSDASDAAVLTANGIKDGLPVVVGFSNDFTSIGRGIASVVSKIATFIRDNASILKDLNESIANAVQQAMEFKIELNNDQIDQISELEGMVEELQNISVNDRPKRDAIGAAAQNLEVHRQAYITAQAEGFRLLKERESFNKTLAAKVQKNRYQDMIFRLSRNEAMSKYQTSFTAAARYAWLAARAYDYETSLDPGHPAAPGALLDSIVKERQLGAWSDGQPSVAHGGLAEILAQLKGNFDVLKGQLGINNPQAETEKISLRSELFRIGPGAAGGGEAASDDRWKDALKARIVPDLNQMPEFVRHCRPFATGVQPGIVIRFPSCIEAGRNFFGQQLAPGDHSYSTANFATKIQSFGVWLDNYAAAGLSTTPRAYLVPAGNDYLRTSSSALPVTRSWSVVEQRIPIPFTINQSNLTSPDFIPTLDGVDGAFGELRRHGDFRMYHDAGGTVDDSETISDSRLIGRSVWNSEWLLIIPGADLHGDPMTGLEQLANTITDIKLYFLTYCHHGQ